MAKERLCTKCTYNNNGWCKARKTNKGLKDLVRCGFRKEDRLIKLKDFLEQKKYEAEIDGTDYNKGIIKGLEIAINIVEE